MIIDSKLKKETGATFTPALLADFIADRLVHHASFKKNEPLKILDPACGDGALLSAISQKLKNKATSFELLGFDTNQSFLYAAQERLSLFLDHALVTLKQRDFLEEIKPAPQQPSLFSTSTNTINNQIDLIIANPPYVRTQLLGTDYAQSIAKKFNLKGRVDLYYPFLLGMSYALKEGGLVGAITSNRYLSTKSGASIRKFLDKNFDILEVIDLGDTKLFEAAVLPAIFIGRKKSPISKSSSSKFIKIYEELSDYKGPVQHVPNVESALHAASDGFFKINKRTFKKTSGTIKYIPSKDATWALLSHKEDKWVEQIHKNTSCIIKDLFKVRVGIKTTADKVFIKDNWESLGPNSPEEALLKDLISQENIEPWEISDNKKLRVLYPHKAVNGKKVLVHLEDFPNALNYLNEHKERLSSRKYLIDAGRKWFELWVPQHPALWAKPKLVFPDISTSPRFYFDESGKIVNGNCYWIVAQQPEDIDSLLLIQGIANTMLMTKYHELMFNNKLYSGRRRYFSQFVERYPLPSSTSTDAQTIISIVKQLNDSSTRNKTSLINQLEIAVAQSFGVEPVFSLI